MLSILRSTDSTLGRNFMSARIQLSGLKRTKTSLYPFLAILWFDFLIYMWTRPHRFDDCFYPMENYNERSELLSALACGARVSFLQLFIVWKYDEGKENQFVVAINQRRWRHGDRKESEGESGEWRETITRRENRLASKILQHVTNCNYRKTKLSIQ